MFWKIVLVLGVLGVLLGFLVTGVSVALPIVNGPHTSWDEAMLGIIPGAGATHRLARLGILETASPRRAFDHLGLPPPRGRLHAGGAGRRLAGV